MVERSTLALIPIAGQILGVRETVCYSSGVIVSLGLVALNKLQEQYHLRYSGNKEKQYDARLNLNQNLKFLSDRVYNLVLAIGTILWVGGVYRYIDAQRDMIVQEALSNALDNPQDNDALEKLKRVYFKVRSSPEVAYRIGKCIQPKNKDSNYLLLEKAAFRWIYEAADAHHPEAQYDFAAHQKQLGQSGLEWFEKAAFNGHAKSQIAMFDITNEEYWLDKAVQANDEAVKLQVVERYKTRNQNAKANFILNILAHNGCVQAQYELGFQFQNDLEKVANGLIVISPPSIRFYEMAGRHDFEASKHPKDFGYEARKGLARFASAKDKIYSPVAYEALKRIAARNDLSEAVKKHLNSILTPALEAETAALRNLWQIENLTPQTS